MSRQDAALLADVAVVVLCHDRLEEVRRTVPARIADVHEHGLELVVVDNASTDGSGEWLSELHAADPSFTLVRTERNLGVGAGRNAGWLRTTRTVIVTHDEDAHVATEDLRRLADRLLGERGIGIVHPIPVGMVDGRPQIDVVPAPHRATNFHGACYAIRRDVVAAVGMHDDRCDFGGEELDLSIRVRAGGWDVVQMPDLRVPHHSIARSGTIASWRRVRWTQNHARVVWRSFPPGRALGWSLLMLLGELRAAVRRGAGQESPALVRAWLAGLREGREVHARVPHDVTLFYASRFGLIATLRRLRGRAA